MSGLSIALSQGLSSSNSGSAVGRDYMYFDGVDDDIELPAFASATNATIEMQVRLFASGSDTTQGVLWGTLETTNWSFIGRYDDGSGTNHYAGLGTPSIKVDGVAKTTRDELHDALLDGSQHTVLIEGANLSTEDSNRIGQAFASANLHAAGYIWDVKMDESGGTTWDHIWPGTGNALADWADTVGSADATAVNGGTVSNTFESEPA